MARGRDDCTTAFKSDFIRDLNFIATNAPKVGIPPFDSIKFTLKPLRIAGENYLELDIMELNLSTRAERALRNNKVNTLGELIEAWCIIPAFRNAGVTTIKEIKNKLLSFHYDQLNAEKREKFWKDALANMR